MRIYIIIHFFTLLFSQLEYDCNGDWGGTAELDDCGICAGGNTIYTSNEFQDCDNVCFGEKIIDDCSNCNIDRDLLKLGDSNNDNYVDVADIFTTIQLILSNNFDTIADMDNNCIINVADVVDIVNQILGLSQNICWHFYTPNISPSDTRNQIQVSINNAYNNGCDLLFETETYIIDNTLLIPSNIKIDFNGSTISRVTNTNMPPFDILANDNQTSGNTSIIIRDLIIEGNGDIDNLDPVIDNNRFSGIILSNVSNSKLINIDVYNTINAEHRHGHPNEHAASGIFITNESSNIYCYNINAYNNNLTGITIYNSDNITINGSRTENNFGSGIGSRNSDYCKFYNIYSFNNGLETSLNTGFSNISVNGERCIVHNAVTENSYTGAGLNIGHASDDTEADYSIIHDLTSFENKLSGIMIKNSDHLQLIDLNVYLNEEHNVWIKNEFNKCTQTYYDANHISIRGGSRIAENVNGYGLRIEGLNEVKIDHNCDGSNIDTYDSDVPGYQWIDQECGGHIISNAHIFDNFHNGIGVINLENNCIDGLQKSVLIDDLVNIYDNGQINHNSSGIRLDNSMHSIINCPNIYDNNGWQNYDIHILDGGYHQIYYPNPLNIHENNNTSNNYIDTCN